MLLLFNPNPIFDITTPPPSVAVSVAPAAVAAARLAVVKISVPIATALLSFKLAIVKIGELLTVNSRAALLRITKDLLAVIAVSPVSAVLGTIYAKRSFVSWDALAVPVTYNTSEV